MRSAIVNDDIAMRLVAAHFSLPDLRNIRYLPRADTPSTPLAEHPMLPSIVVRDLHKRYGALHAVRGVSFSVEAGEIFGLLGPNGAGKTTTVECIIGLRDPDEGSVEVCGIDAARDPRAVKQKIGAALQSTALQDRITPREALGLFGSMYDRRASASDLLDRFSLSGKADVPVDSLSGGQRQRLALALAFVNRPDVIFLDEPTAGLDPLSRRELHEEIRQMRSDRQAVMLTTHYIEEAEDLCDRVGIISEGRIIAMGTPAELIAQSAATPIVTLTTSTPVDGTALARLPGIQDPVVKGVSVHFRTPDVRSSMPGLLGLLESEDIDVIGLNARRATLEDVFVELTGERPSK